jgi:S-adenosylmethionine-diacylglycerol 3-amino-3-carboxypropyl transferase
MRHQVVNLPVQSRRPLSERLVFNGIVFNMSWEDPEMDRRAFRLEADRHTVLSISSAGCNPLNLLCQSPERLISIDGNPAQNAILELKLAAIETLDHETFFNIFASQKPSLVTRVYRRRLRPNLSAYAQDFWDRNLWQVARNLYDFGRMGLFCRILRHVLTLLGIPKCRREAFFELRSLDQQRRWYERYAAPRLWGPVVRRLVNFRPFLYLAGVHPEQYTLVDERHDIYEYIKERVEYALTRIPIYDNYFLRVAVTGRMRGRRVPPYLLEENFHTLRRNLDRVTVVNGWLGPYLNGLPPNSIDRFNLLDIFDWMSPEMFESTLRSVLRVARPDARIIYRSGSYRLDPPPAIRSRLHHHAELSRELLAIDRSATYGSFYVFSLKGPRDAARREPHTPQAATV